MIHTHPASQKDLNPEFESDSHPLDDLCRPHLQCRHNGHPANSVGDSASTWFNRRLEQWQTNHPDKDLTDFKRDLLLTWWTRAADLAGDGQRPVGDHHDGNSPHYRHGGGQVPQNHQEHHDICHCDNLCHGCHDDSIDPLLQGERAIGIDYSVTGKFGPLLDWGSTRKNVVPIHVGLLPDGRVFSFGQYSNKPNTIIYDVWNPKAVNSDDSHKIISMTNSQYRSFCNAMMLLPNSGKLLMSGGSTLTNANEGSKHVHLFDYRTDQLTMLPKSQFFKDPRWYPTLTTLTDGRILAQGGRAGTQENAIPTTTLEFYTEGQGWKQLTNRKYGSIYGKKNGWYYPRSWIDPDNGHVFGLTWNKMYSINPETGVLTIVGDFKHQNRGATSTAVMYEPGKILQVGGGDIDSAANSQKLASKQATIIDINGTTPSIRKTNAMNSRRDWANATILPDGKVLVTGGGSSNNFNNGKGAVRTAEIWDPDTETWTEVDTAAADRLYHSTALLLPDGRVLTGGGTTNYRSKTLDKRKTVEFYTPPNLLTQNGAPAIRPQLEVNKTAFRWGGQLTATADQKIDRVTLLGFGTVTHSFDMGQRFIELEFTPQVVGNKLKIDAPSNANLAPPGYYMMFAINKKGVYSEAKIIHLTAGGAIASVVGQPDPQHDH